MAKTTPWGWLALTAPLLLAGCSTDFLAPEDERCTLYVAEGEAAEISRWQLDHCASVRILVVRFG